jgi:hypothetical protein
MASSDPGNASLQTVKLVHTLVWAWRNDLRAAMILIVIVALEVLVLVANRFRCPLTSIAARYTKDRKDNFDIYLPLWVARYNKQIFGSLYVAGIFYTLVQWKGT